MPGFRNMMKRSMRKSGGKVSMTPAQKQKAMETLKKYKGETKMPVQKRTTGVTKGTPMVRTKKGIGGAVRIGLAVSKYLKNNPDKVKKIMQSDLPKKTKDLLSKMKSAYGKKK
jgi:hypothetical protein